MRLNPRIPLATPVHNYTFAKLIPIDGVGDAWEFLINPTSIDISFGATHDEKITPGGWTPHRQYIHPDSEQLTLSVILTTPSRGDVSELIIALKGMTTPENGEISPIEVVLEWGERRSKPSWVTSCNFTETEWLSGRCTRAEGTITLIESGLSDDEAVARNLGEPAAVSPSMDAQLITGNVVNFREVHDTLRLSPFDVDSDFLGEDFTTIDASVYAQRALPPLQNAVKEAVNTVVNESSTLGSVIQRIDWLF